MNANALIQCISSLESYPNSKDFRIRILKGDKKVMELVSQTVCSVLETTSATPLCRLLAVRLAKDCIETFNDEFISQSQTNILTKFEEIALFNREFRDGNRGRTLFSDQPNQEQAQLGVSMLRLVLECLWVWSKWFPVDPDTNKMSMYKLTVEKLLKLGVIFPKLIYFDFQDVARSLPDHQVPVALLREAKKVVQEDLENNRGAFSPTKKLVAQLNINIIDVSKNSNAGAGDIFPVDRIKRVLKTKTLQDEQNKSKLPHSVDHTKALKYKSFTQAELKGEVRELIVKKQKLENELQQTDALIQYLKAVIKERQAHNNPQQQAQPQSNLQLNLDVPRDNNAPTNSSSPLVQSQNKITDKSNTMTSTHKSPSQKEKDY